MGFINKDQLEFIGNEMSNNQYGKYLLKIADQSINLITKLNLNIAVKFLSLI